MKASLIIPTYNRGEVLPNTIEMALNQTYSDYEVIVVDQSPSLSAELQAYLDSVRDRIRYIKLQIPNLPAARNAGVAAAKGEIVVFIDDDVVIDERYVASHVAHYEDPHVGGVMGLTLPDEDVNLDLFIKRALEEFSAASGLNNGVARVIWVNGGNTSYRREAIVSAGMSDERFPSSARCEDADLAVRVRNLGYILLLDSNIRLVHLALRYGGCGNREPSQRARVEEEHIQALVFHFVKNRRIFGVPTLIRQLIGVYRGCVMNRTQLRRGARNAVRRQLLYLGSVVRAYRSSSHADVDQSSKFC